MFNQSNNSFWVLTAEVGSGVLVLFLPLIFFNEELIALMNCLSKKVGPTFYVLFVISSYILGGLLLAFFETDYRKVPKLLDHLEAASGVSLTIGMIGTYVSFAETMLQEGGISDIKLFANALFSTLFALIIIALVSIICELLKVIRAPYANLNWNHKNNHE